MKECSKSISRRLSDSNFISKYFVGVGVDVGGKPDPLSLYSDFFPLVSHIKTWDLGDGDAQYMATVPDEFYDFVHSSHCLEHLVDPHTGLSNWLRITKPGGHLIVTVPDEDLYEQGVFPSDFNKDHKWTFKIYKDISWSSRSINILDLVISLGESAEVIRIEQLNSTYRYNLPRYDQSLTPVGECGIELVIRKRLPQEIEDKGRWRRPIAQPDAEIKSHLNQYYDDMLAMKTNNSTRPPFKNVNDI
jgi:SAM-dependent methyltransferase